RRRSGAERCDAARYGTRPRFGLVVYSAGRRGGSASNLHRASFRSVPRVLRVRAERKARAHVHVSIEHAGTLRVAGDARRSDVRTRKIRRDPERGDRRRAAAMIARGCIVALTLGLAACSVEPPDFATVKNRYKPSEAYLLDRHGALLHVSRIDYAVRRTEWIPLPELSAVLPDAIIAGEDRRFREHRGVDWRSLARAGFDTATGRGRRGASTLAMQLAPLVAPTLAPGPRGRTAMPKLRQIAAAIAIERRWSKAQILEAYLNLADFRGDATGIRAASASLLGKHPSGSHALDAALLAALLPAPNASAPRLARRACAVAAYLAPPADCARLKAAAARLTARLSAPLPAPGDA